MGISFPLDQKRQKADGLAVDWRALILMLPFSHFYLHLPSF
jgi:hypothetical protein